MPDPLTEPPALDPIYEAQFYCNIPSVPERSVEGKIILVSVSVVCS